MFVKISVKKRMIKVSGPVLGDSAGFGFSRVVPAGFSELFDG